MKKTIVVLFAVSFLMVGCATLNPRYTKPGGSFLPQNSVLEAEQDLEQIAQSYAITEQVTGQVKVFIEGDNYQSSETAKKVFDDFGFQVVQNDKDAEYHILVYQDDLAHGSNYTSGFGYTGTQKKIVKAGLKIVKDGVEHFYEGAAQNTYSRNYSGYYHSSYQYQNNPGYFAFKGALMEAIGKFIETEGFLHSRPKN